MSCRYLFLLIFCTACRSQFTVSMPARHADAAGGEAFYKKIIPLSREEREAIALQEIVAGNVPGFLKKFSSIKISVGDSVKAEYFVSPDYLCIGSDADFARIPLTPMTAQLIADAFQCFLPTRKMVNDIYQHATVKIEPVPLLDHRDSALTFWHHHLAAPGL